MADRWKTSSRGANNKSPSVSRWKGFPSKFLNFRLRDLAGEIDRVEGGRGEGERKREYRGRLCLSPPPPDFLGRLAKRFRIRLIIARDKTVGSHCENSWLEVARKEISMTLWSFHRWGFSFEIWWITGTERGCKKYPDWICNFVNIRSRCLTVCGNITENQLLFIKPKTWLYQYPGKAQFFQGNFYSKIVHTKILYEIICEGSFIEYRSLE